METSKQCEVLVVGAGPVGLTMAAFLKHYGLDVRIIDKKNEPTKTSNAVGMQSRTLELFEILGLNEKFNAAGRQIQKFKNFKNKKVLGEFDFSHLKTKYPYICNIPQSATEAILIEYLKTQAVEVERNKTFLNFNQQNEGIVAEVENFVQKKETITCRYLIGCDGFHSSVREILKMPYEGDDLKLKFFMIDSAVSWDETLDAMYMSNENNVGLVMFPMLNSVRMIAEVSNSEKYKNLEEFDEQIFMEMVAAGFPGKMKIEKPLWKSHFWVHERLAKHYRVNNVFLMGDAAHAHSPAGGQGMNTGMQDAINLAWKLVWTMKNNANDKLLASYEEERRPVARRVLDRSILMTKLGVGGSVIANFVRKFLVSFIMRSKAVQTAFTQYISEVAVNYRGSSVVAGSAMHGLQPGDRMVDLPINPQHKAIVLDYSGDLANCLNEFAACVEVCPMKDARKKGYCLVRPDHYIGFLGHDKKALQQYLQSLLHN